MGALQISALTTVIAVMTALDNFGETCHCHDESKYEAVLGEPCDPGFFAVWAQDLVSAAGLREDAAAVAASTRMRVGQGLPRRWFSITRMQALT